MTNFNYDLIMQPNTVVHCDTEEKGLELCKWADSKGLKWISGMSYLTMSNWGEYKNDTCYFLYQGEYCRKDFYKQEGYTILKYEDIVINEDTIDNNFKKYDTGKNMVSLIPPEFILGIGSVFTYGANKYDKNNWKLCEDTDRYKDALLRHLLAYLSGEEKDSESGLSHLYHCGANIAFLDYFDRIKGVNNDN